MRQRIRRCGGAKQLCATAAFQASLEALEAAGFDCPRKGEKRRSARRLALHLAREAFNVAPIALACAAGCERSSTKAAQRAVWARRDADPELDARLWSLTDELRGARAPQPAGTGDHHG